MESVDSVDELYRKLLSALLDQEFVGRLSRASRRFSHWVKQIRIEEIGSKVRFGASGPVDHLGEFVRFCRGLELDGRIVLMVDELPQAVENTLGSKVDRAFTLLLTHQNLFEHWYGRLRMTLEPRELQFIKAVLGQAADPHDNGIHSRSVTNLAVEHGLLEHQVNLIGILKHDGYLNNQEDPARSRFNSPVIREWWWRNVAN